MSFDDSDGRGGEGLRDNAFLDDSRISQIVAGIASELLKEDRAVQLAVLHRLVSQFDSMDRRRKGIAHITAWELD